MVVATVAALTAVASVRLHPHPTASPAADVVVTALAVGAVAWSGATAPWWALGVASGMATLLAGSATSTALAAVAFVLALYVGSRVSGAATLRSISAGLCALALLDLRPVGFFGASAALAGAAMALLVVLGVRRRSSLVRRRASRVAKWAGVAVAVLAAGGILAVLQARGDVTDGERAARAAIESVQDGDLDQASNLLSTGGRSLGRAERTMERPWARAARVVPVLGQHVAAVQAGTDAAARLVATAEISVAQVDVDDLRVVNGAIDLNAVEVLAGPLEEMEAALDAAARRISDASSSWLIAPLSDRVSAVGNDIGELLHQTRQGLTTVEVAPALLGRDAPRTYFVAFTTPAEARGLGGFMGSWAELEAAGGRIRLVRSGTTNDLTSAMRADRPAIVGMDDYLSRYGRFGAGENGNPVAVDYWSNVTMSPDFPSVAQVIAQLYPASGGRQVDGVLAVDVFALAELMRFTGPLTVGSGADERVIDADNAIEWLLRGQYADVAEDDVRDVMLAQMTEQLVSGVFGGDLPGPRVLGSALGPALGAGRIVMWSRDEAEEQALEALGISGSLPAPPADGLAVVANNAGANKLDAYVRRAVRYEVVFDAESGELRGTIHVTVTNDAPDQLPEDIAGNPFGLPVGTNRIYLSVYSPWQLDRATVAGTPVGMEVDRDAGWNVYSTFLNVPPGETAELEFGVAGVLPDPSAYSVTLRGQPSAAADFVRVDVRTTSGDQVHARAGQLSGLEIGG